VDAVTSLVPVFRALADTKPLARLVLRAPALFVSIAQFVAGLGFLLVLLVAFFFELTVRLAPREFLHTDKQRESQFTRSRTLRLPVLGAHTQDHDAAVKWSASRAAGVLGSGVGVGGQVGAATLQDVCSCSHAEAGLRAAMRACAGRVDSKEGELVQALTLQVCVTD
jgi:hypothetical protein